MLVKINKIFGVSKNMFIFASVDSDLRQNLVIILITHKEPLFAVAGI